MSDHFDLYARIKRAGITMQTLCERAEVHPTTPARWGKSTPRGATLARMEAAMDRIEAEKAA